MSKIIIFGAGGFAREVQLLCEELKLEVVGFLDERPEMKGKIVNDVPILGDIDDIQKSIRLHSLNKSDVSIVCAGVGDPSLKVKFVRKTKDAGYKIARSLIHPGVNISKRNTIGNGSIVCQGNVLTVNISIGDFVIINQNCSLGHDDKIHDYVTISPGANISGEVEIGEGTYIGTGVGIKEKIKIGEWSIIGGNAFVKDDVPSKTLYVGVPATCKKVL